MMKNDTVKAGMCRHPQEAEKVSVSGTGCLQDMRGEFKLSVCYCKRALTVHATNMYSTSIFICFEPKYFVKRTNFTQISIFNGYIKYCFH